MAIFPDIDLSGAAELPAQSQNGALPAGNPVGVLSGLNQSLLAMLANFSPGDLGVCVVDENLQLSLPLPDWASWSWLESGITGTIAVGYDGLTVLYTVPGDERVTLYGARALGVSGDNLGSEFVCVPPAGYKSANAAPPTTADYLILMQYTTSLSEIYWPTKAAVLLDHPGPVDLEPGTTINLHLNGGGVATSTYDYYLWMKRTKIVRQLLP